MRTWAGFEPRIPRVTDSGLRAVCVFPPHANLRTCVSTHCVSPALGRRAGGCTELNPAWPLSDAGKGNVASKRSRHRLRAAPAERSASRLCSCCAPSHRSSHFRQRSRGVHMSQFRKLLRRMSRSRGMSQFRTAAQQARRCHCHKARRRRRQRCACGSAAVDDRRARRPPRDRHAPPPRSTC